MNLVLIAIACGVVALLYGILTSQQVLRASAGNARMMEVAAAIQEGRAPICAVSIRQSLSSASSLPR